MDDETGGGADIPVDTGGDSIDTSVDTSADTSSDADIPDDIPEDAPGESSEAPDDVPEDVPDDIPEDTGGDIPESPDEDDIPDDIPEDVSEEAPADDPLGPEGPEDIPEDADVDGPEEVTPEESGDMPEDIPEDAGGEDANGQEQEIEPGDVPEDTVIDEPSMGNGDKPGDNAVEATEVITDESGDKQGDVRAEEPGDVAGRPGDEPIDSDISGDQGAEDTAGNQPLPEAEDGQTDSTGYMGSDNGEQTESPQISRDEALRNAENECMENSLVRTADFRDFDPDVASSMVDALEDAKRDFPDLDVKYFGTMQNQLDGIHDAVAERYEQGLRETYGDNYTDEQYKAASGAYADQFMADNDLYVKDDSIAWSVPSGDAGIEKYDGIGINQKYASDYEGFQQCKEHEVDIRHKPIGCDTPRATADHELGHEVDRLLNAGSDSQIQSYYDDMMSKGDAAEKLSTYSTTNINEFIAESYSEYRNNSNPREYSTAVYNRLTELNSLRRVG